MEYAAAIVLLLAATAFSIAMQVRGIRNRR